MNNRKSSRGRKTVFNTKYKYGKYVTETLENGQKITKWVDDKEAQDLYVATRNLSCKNKSTVKVGDKTIPYSEYLKTLGFPERLRFKKVTFKVRLSA